MKNNLYTRYFYFACLILFFILNLFFKVKPKLRKINLNLINYENYSLDSKNSLVNLKSFDKRFSVGETFAFRDNTHWYKVSLVSFWKKESLNLNLLKKSFVEHNFIIKIVNNSNYALATHNNSSFVYACLDSPNNFYFDFYHKKVPRVNDLNYWKKVYKKGIGQIFNSFKPNNYECLLIISSDKNFFKDSEENKRNLIFSKYFYSSEKK